MGTTMKVISMKSKMKPSRKMTSMTIASAPQVPPGMLVNQLCTNSSPPYPRNTSENTEAPIKMKNTIAVVFSVVRQTSDNTSRSRARLPKASSVAPAAPTPAASVGVAMPASMLPSTATIRTSGATNPLTRAAAVTRDLTPAGASSGRKAEISSV